MLSACAVPKGAAKRAALLEKHNDERGQIEYIGKALEQIKQEMHDPATPAPRVQHLQHQFMAVPSVAYCALLLLLRVLDCCILHMAVALRILDCCILHIVVAYCTLHIVVAYCTLLLLL